MSGKQTYTPPWQVHFQRGYQRGAEDMREAAAKLCDSKATELNPADAFQAEAMGAFEEAAEAIRALPLPEPPK